MAYRQQGNPFSRKTSSPLFNNKNKSISTILPSQGNVKTTIDDTNLNEQGESQTQVVDNAYNKIQQRIKEINNFYNSFNNLDDMSSEDITRFDEMEPEMINNLENSERNFIRVSDSINRVNKSPFNYNSPLNDNHDGWEETLQDERGGYDVGEWGNETRVTNPDGSVTITQTRDLNKQGSGGEGFVNPNNPDQTWDEWLKTPEGQEWQSKNTGQDTRTRTIRKREPISSVSKLTPSTIEPTTNDERSIDKIETRKVISSEDQKRMIQEMETRRKEDEKSNRKRKRKNFFRKIGWALGDVGDAIGDVGGFVLGNTGRSLVDIATAPVDLVRSIRPCRTCRKGIFDPSQMGILGGRSGLAQNLFSQYRR